jgi:hypothetical protein
MAAATVSDAGMVMIHATITFRATPNARQMPCAPHLRQSRNP